MALSTTTRKSLFGINALSAWIGFGMSTFIELFGLVEPLDTGEPQLPRCLVTLVTMHQVWRAHQSD